MSKHKNRDYYQHGYHRLPAHRGSAFKWWYLPQNGFIEDGYMDHEKPVGWQLDGKFIPFACQGQRKRTGKTRRKWRVK